MHYTKEKEFEENINVIKNIIHKLQEGHIPFDKAKNKHEEGLSKIDFCLRLLDKGKQKVEIVSEKGHKLYFKPAKIK